jgi:hypothetical protein
MSVCCECCVLSGRCLCDELITCLEESYHLWCIIVCDLETSWMTRPWPNGGCCAKRKTSHDPIINQRYKLLCFYDDVVRRKPVLAKSSKLITKLNSDIGVQFFFLSSLGTDICTYVMGINER